MSEQVAFFARPWRTTAVSLPFDYRRAIADWSGLRKTMVRKMPEGFTRDEWAYLVSFLHDENLLVPFTASFGTPADSLSDPPDVLCRPRGGIAVWLPNNVSLLGPLTLIFLSLTGQPIRLKLGSSAQDLAGIFLQYARMHLPRGDLQSSLETQVQTERFERGDPRNTELTEWAQVRIVFGSDEAAAAIHGLRHPLGSVGISFVDRQSEAWLEAEAVNDELLSTLLKVFAIYGQAGCTSPRRVVLVDGTAGSAVALRDRLVELWPEVVGTEVPMHVASENIMAAQWARAVGWDARIVEGNSAVLAVGTHELQAFDALYGLRILYATRQQALDGLPGNIQTIGHALLDAADPRWLQWLADTGVSRFVPLAQMHHFGHIWDGQDYWAQCFETMEISQ